MTHWKRWSLDRLRRLRRRIRSRAAAGATRRELRGFGPEVLWDIGIASHQITEVAAGLVERAETPAAASAELARTNCSVISFRPSQHAVRGRSFDDRGCCAA